MLVFLDIDGVMVPAKGWKKPELLSDGFPVFSLSATQVIQDLVSDNTTIMLTTSHKSRYSINEWKAIFKNRGITVKHLKVLNENTNNVSRRDEILNWFKENHTTEDFIIIDDDKSLNDLPSFQKERLILTSAMIGLTSEHFNVIKSILGHSEPQLV